MKLCESHHGALIKLMHVKIDIIFPQNKRKWSETCIWLGEGEGVLPITAAGKTQFTYQSRENKETK